MVRPALCKTKVGNGKLLMAFAPINRRPAYYLIWVDSRWFKDGELLDEHWDRKDEIYDAIEDDFGRYDSDPPEDEEPEEYVWPAVDLDDGSAWWEADDIDVLTRRQQLRLLPLNVKSAATGSERKDHE